MDSNSLDRLPRAYRLGLQLEALGADTELIAECLEIPAAGVETLLLLGRRKLIQEGPEPTQSAEKKSRKW